MTPRQHAVAAVNGIEVVVCQLRQTWMKGERESTIKAIECEIALAIQAERDRCMAWTLQFDTPETRRTVQGIESGELPPGH